MSVWQDFRQAARSLQKSSAFTTLAALTLALGIGANTAMFSVIQAAFLTHLPFPDEERLAMLWPSNPEQGIARSLVSPANFVDWDALNTVFEHLGAWPTSSDTVVAFNLRWQDSSERVRGMYVSSGFFRALGVQALLGRTFSPEEDRLRDHRAAVLSHSYWRERFRGDPAILGKTIEVDTFRGGVYTIVGVMPASFDFPPGTQVFLPIAFWGGGPLPGPDAAGRCCAWFSVVGRLKPGVTMERARTEMTALARRISERYPAGPSVTDVQVVPLRTEIVGSHRTGLLVLFGAVGCVLLIACANVANLAVSRALTRSAEMAIRSALGASTARLVRQVLVESLLLSGLGAGVGVLLAFWAQRLLIQGLSGNVPLLAGARMDWGVLAFAIVITLAAAGLCGLAPAVQLASGSLRSTLQGRVRSHTEAPRGSLLRRALMAGQVALAVALVAVAGLLIRSLLQLQRVDPGFQAENVLAISFDFTAGPFRGPGNQQPYFHDLMMRIAGLPGVRMVGAVSEPPLARRRVPDQPLTLEGRPARSASESPQVITRAVTPAYFPIMGIPLKKGRLFTEGDTGDGKLVAIVNETAARRYWPGADPIGKSLAMGSLERFGYFRVPPAPGQAEWREIVGIVGDVRSSALDVPPQPEIFYSYRQYPWYGPTMLVRTGGDPLLLAAAIRREAMALNSRAVVTDVKTMQQIAADSIAQPRFRAALIGLFAALAMLLGMLGIYGVMSYAATQRTQEIGIRMALGATRSDAAWLVVGQALRTTGIGLVLGIVAALISARWMSSLLYGVSSADPVTLAGACAVFGGAALVASYLPARRAAAVDPSVALRSD
jgi:predicted permease